MCVGNILISVRAIASDLLRPFQSALPQVTPKAGAYLPAMSIRRIACGMENPSNTGTACVTPSPESRTIPVVRPDEYLSSAGGIKGESSLQTEDSLNTGKEGRYVEGLEKDLSCYIPILPRI
jgi:hypothetical protein